MKCDTYTHSHTNAHSHIDFDIVNQKYAIKYSSECRSTTEFEYIKLSNNILSSDLIVYIQHVNVCVIEWMNERTSEWVYGILYEFYNKIMFIYESKWSKTMALRWLHVIFLDPISLCVHFIYTVYLQQTTPHCYRAVN